MPVKSIENRRVTLAGFVIGGIQLSFRTKGEVEDKSTVATKAQQNIASGTTQRLLTGGKGHHTVHGLPLKLVEPANIRRTAARAVLIRPDVRFQSLPPGLLIGTGQEFKWLRYTAISGNSTTAWDLVVNSGVFGGPFIVNPLVQFFHPVSQTGGRFPIEIVFYFSIVAVAGVNALGGIEDIVTF